MSLTDYRQLLVSYILLLILDTKVIVKRGIFSECKEPFKVTNISLVLINSVQQIQADMISANENRRLQ